MSNSSTPANIESWLAAFESVVTGKKEVGRCMLACLIAGGHVLIEDEPGVGKTTAARSLARVVGLPFTRIQFTADLMPADIVGYNMVVMSTGELRFRPGPIKGGVVLADELNRASPRTQSALLEAMEEGQVTVEGETRPLEKPFMVLATQNPMNHAGTFRLPASQMDRFMVGLSMGYAKRDDEIKLLKARVSGDPLSALQSLAASADIEALQAKLKNVQISDELLSWQVDTMRLIRESSDLPTVSTRCGRSWVHLAMAFALIDGRDYVSSQDLAETLEPVLSHRLSGQGSLAEGRARLQKFREKLTLPL